MAYKKSAETRQKIVDATKKLFQEKGYYNTNIKDIAKEVNVAHPCIYYYFKNKESIAREIFDTIVEKIIKLSNEIYDEYPDRLLNTMVSYICLFKYIATSKITQAVFYDLVEYSNYDKSNIDRLKNTIFLCLRELFEEYHGSTSDKQIIAYILTSDAFTKALFKGILNGLLELSFEEASDYFFRHMLISHLKISEDLYLEKFHEAQRLCKNIELDE